MYFRFLDPQLMAEWLIENLVTKWTDTIDLELAFFTSKGWDPKTQGWEILGSLIHCRNQCRSCTTSLPLFQVFLRINTSELIFYCEVAHRCWVNGYTNGTESSWYNPFSFRYSIFNFGSPIHSIRLCRWLNLWWSFPCLCIESKKQAVCIIPIMVCIANPFSVKVLLTSQGFIDGEYIASVWVTSVFFFCIVLQSVVRLEWKIFIKRSLSGASIVAQHLRQTKMRRW